MLNALALGQRTYINVLFQNNPFIVPLAQNQLASMYVGDKCTLYTINIKLQSIHCAELVQKPCLTSIRFHVILKL